jgi:dUTP pyrophosphatase
MAARKRTGAPAPLPVAVQRLPGAGDIALPAPASERSAGVDLHAAVAGELVIEPGARALVPTGIAVAIPDGYEGQVRARSGLALHHGVLLPNGPGTIDSDYRGEVKVILLNAGCEPFVVRRGDRIAQLVVSPVARIAWREREALDETARGVGGFGHSGRRGVAARSRRKR